MHIFYPLYLAPIMSLESLNLMPLLGKPKKGKNAITQKQQKDINDMLDEMESNYAKLLENNDESPKQGLLIEVCDPQSSFLNDSVVFCIVVDTYLETCKFKGKNLQQNEVIILLQFRLR